MSTKLKLTPLALAVAALFASPLALAQDTGTSINYVNNTRVQLEHQNRLQNDISVNGEAIVTGVIPVNAESGATVDTKQQTVEQRVQNGIVNNNASVDESSFSDAQGNAGVNTAAGDNNAQSNDAALSAVDAQFVFANASSYGYQTATGNGTMNVGTRNRASLGGDAFMNFQGNAGVNVAAGDSNVQANALAASVNNSGTLAKATSYTNQITAGNQTQNQGQTYQIRNVLDVSLRADLSGGYSGGGSGSYAGRTEGTLWQQTNFYPDNWVFNPQVPTNQQHPNSPDQISHSDFDWQTQGTVLNPIRSTDDAPVGGLAFDARGSEGGQLGFEEAGSQTLGGTVSGQVVYLQTVFRPHVNSATLGGNAFSAAQGNFGVNIAAGTNNLQRNSLAIAAAQGAGGGGGAGGNE